MGAELLPWRRRGRPWQAPPLAPACLALVSSSPDRRASSGAGPAAMEEEASGGSRLGSPAGWRAAELTSSMQLTVEAGCGLVRAAIGTGG